MNLSANFAVTPTGYNITQGTLPAGLVGSVSAWGTVTARQLADGGFVGTAAGKDVWFSVQLGIQKYSPAGYGQAELYFGRTPSSGEPDANYASTNFTGGFVVGDSLSGTNSSFCKFTNSNEETASSNLPQLSTGAVFGSGPVHLIVGRINLKDSGTSTISYWIDPNDVSSVAALGTATATDAANDFGGSIQWIGVEVRGIGNGSGAGAFDALRISDGNGNSNQAFGDIVGVPEPASLTSVVLGL